MPSRRHQISEHVSDRLDRLLPPPEPEVCIADAAERLGDPPDPLPDVPDMRDQPDPPPLDDGPAGHRLVPGRRLVRILAIAAVLVVAVGAAVAWRSHPRLEPLTGPDTPVATDPAASSSSASLVVAVSGRVRRPGLVRLPAGARVADAVEAAGGVLPGTDLGTLNLARRVVDGELIVVGAAPGPASPAKVNLNTATSEQLLTLPGVGPVLAKRILAYRERHGGFRSVEELRQVQGIGPARYEELKDLVTT